MPHGKICYLEIPANRAEDSARFYSEIFGWRVRERGDGNLAFDDTGAVSGTWVEEGDRTPEERTRTYIMVDSITESLEQIEKAGGRVVTPRTDIGPNMGAFAAFTDPVGNEFGLYEEPNRQLHDPSVPLLPELPYADVPAAARWLCDAFGFTERLRIGTHRIQLHVGAGSMVVVEGSGAPGLPLDDR